jgi:2,4-dienoyl-CoA reductase-like NADH-dependent reductase (Old Yellow Enzyme family)
MTSALITKSRLFTPARMREVMLANRLVVAPMCQYSAEDGVMTDWHLMHLGSLANSGAGLLFIEATAVTREGRITHGCTALHNDAQQAAMTRVVAAAKTHGSARIGLQLGHAGRKASAKRPWEGRLLNEANHSEPWPTKAPSAIPFGEDWHTPTAFAEGELEHLVAAFAASTRRAAEIGIDVLEIHAAHGYLLHQFLSPLSNTRTDRFGGSRDNRMRFPLAVFEACRQAWPAAKPLGVRVSAVDWVEGGLDIEDTVAFAKALKSRACDFIDVSTGGNDPTAKVPAAPGFQVPFSEIVRREAGIETMAVGLITEPHQAEAILADGRADYVALARGFLDDPHWGWHAAYALGADMTLPPQYRRAGIKAWDPAKRNRRG